MLDAPKAIGPWLGTQPYLARRCYELRLDVAWHQAALFYLQIACLEAGKIHIGAGQRDTCGFFVLLQAIRIDTVDLFNVLFQTARVVGDVAEHLRQVDVVEREDFANDIEDAPFQSIAHLVELLQEPMQNVSLDDRLALFRVGGDKVKDVDIALLPDAVNAAEALFETRRVPRHVVVNHQVAELEVNPFSRGLRGHTDLRRSTKLFLRPLTFVRVHAAVDLAGRVAPLTQALTHGG